LTNCIHVLYITNLCAVVLEGRMQVSLRSSLVMRIAGYVVDLLLIMILPR